MALPGCEGQQCAAPATLPCSAPPCPAPACPPVPSCQAPEGDYSCAHFPLPPSPVPCRIPCPPAAPGGPGLQGDPAAGGPGRRSGPAARHCTSGCSSATRVRAARGVVRAAEQRFRRECGHGKSMEGRARAAELHPRMRACQAPAQCWVRPRRATGQGGWRPGSTHRDTIQRHAHTLVRTPLLASGALPPPGRPRSRSATPAPAPGGCGAAAARCGRAARRTPSPAGSPAPPGSPPAPAQSERRRGRRGVRGEGMRDMGLWASCSKAGGVESKRASSAALRHATGSIPPRRAMQHHRCSALLPWPGGVTAAAHAPWAAAGQLALPPPRPLPPTPPRPPRPSLLLLLCSRPPLL